MLPSLSLPPLECCFGTSPIQAEKLRPDRKILGSATLATRAVASIGPTRDRLHSDRSEAYYRAGAAPEVAPQLDAERGCAAGNRALRLPQRGRRCANIDKHP